MIAINLGTVTKRINSTARPAVGASFSVSFKQPCSMERPTLILQTSNSVINYNYMYMLGRYYWITDCISIGSGRWEIHAEIDPLATLRTEILSSSAYVKYAAIGYNTDLPDTRLPIPNKAVCTQSQTLYFDSIDPYYILTAAGSNGGLITYALKESAFQSLLQSIQTYQITSMPDISAASDVMGAIRDFGNQLARACRQLFSFGSCLDAVSGCVWIPYAPGLLGGSQTIYLGDYNTGVSGYVVEYSQMRSRSTVVTFPLAGDWRDYAPYTRFSLYIPFYGVVQLPNAAVIEAGGSIEVLTSLAPPTGDISIQVRASGSTKTILTGSGNIAAQVQLTRNSANVLGAASSAVRVAAGDYSAIPSLAASCLDRDVDSAGSLSTVASIGLSTQLIAQTETRYPPAYPANIPVMGHTVGETGTLSTYAGGYVETQDMHIAGSMEDKAITAAAEAALNGGVYLE